MTQDNVIAFQAYRRENNAEYGWRDDRQTLKLDTISEYIDTAENTKAQYTKILNSLVNQFPSASREGPCVKQAKSIQRKLWDSSVLADPDKIKDYLRARILFHDAGDLARAVHKLENANLVSSYKNQFAFPDPETSFRCWKGRLKIQTPMGEFLKCELQLNHAGMKAANALTENIREAQRHCERYRDSIANASRIRENYSTHHFDAAARAVDILALMRSLTHMRAAHDCGLNEILAPSQFEDHGIVPDESTVRSTVQKARDNKFLRKTQIPDQFFDYHMS